MAKAKKSKASKKTAKPKKKRGAPTKYSDALADKICTQIATTELGIHAIAGQFGVTAKSVFEWLTKHKYFRDNYARGKKMQADLMIHTGLDIIDDSRNDTMVRYTKSGEKYTVENTEWTSRSKMRWEARRWLAGKLAPKKYGDKLDVTSKGKKINPNATIIIDLPDEA